ncbi:hypothetical protein D3C86_1598090 [compost metagenome]
MHAVVQRLPAHPFFAIADLSGGPGQRDVVAAGEVAHGSQRGRADLGKRLAHAVVHAFYGGNARFDHRRSQAPTGQRAVANGIFYGDADGLWWDRLGRGTVLVSVFSVCGFVLLFGRRRRPLQHQLAL